jgi:hypothetical protein
VARRYEYLDTGARAVEQEAALVGLDVVPAVTRPALGLLVDLEAFRPELLAVLLGTTTATTVLLVATITAPATVIVTVTAATVVVTSTASVTAVVWSVGVCRVALVRPVLCAVGR